MREETIAALSAAPALRELVANDLEVAGWAAKGYFLDIGRNANLKEICVIGDRRQENFSYLD